MPERGELHLSEERMLLYADGELSGDLKDEVSRHLEACWDCRARYQELQDAIRFIVGARQRSLERQDESIGWQGLSQRIARHEKEKHEAGRNYPGSFHRYSRWLIRHARLAGFTGALVALSIWLGPPASNGKLRAEDLLLRAQAVERSRETSGPGERRRMRLSMRQSGKPPAAQVDYEISFRNGGRRMLEIRAASASAQVVVAQAKAAFAQGLQWDHPTSAAAFQRWRDSVSVVEESIEKRPNFELAIVTRTRRSQEEIHRAEFLVDGANGRAVETAVWVGDREFAVREISVEPLPSTEAAHRSSKAADEERASQQISPSDLEALEMSLREGLHHLGADLGEPIEVYRDNDNRVCLEALGLPGKRLVSVRQLAERFPGVRLVTEPDPRRVDCLHCERTRMESMAIPGVRHRDPEWMNHFVTEAAYERFARESVRRLEEIVNRVYALRRLALAYPPERERLLPPVARAQLHEMLRVHGVSARAGLDQLRALMPLDDQPGLSVDNASSWQAGALLLLEVVKEADLALKTSLGFIAGAPRAAAVRRTLAAVDQSLSALERYTRSL